MKLIQPRFEIKFLQEARDFLATKKSKGQKILEPNTLTIKTRTKYVTD
mgnify:CR=1 FL=1